MLDLVVTYWVWLIPALIAGGAAGYLSTRPQIARGRWVPGWLGWAALVFAIGLVVAILQWLPGQTLLFLSFWCIVGFLAGAWLRGARTRTQVAVARAVEDARRVAEAKAAEEARIAAAEAKAVEDARRVAEAKAAEEARIAAAEVKAVEDTRRAAEAKAAEEARRATEAKAAEDARRVAEAKAAEEARIAAAEAKAVEDARRAAEATVGPDDDRHPPDKMPPRR
jgi:hypothetical protein